MNELKTLKKGESVILSIEGTAFKGKGVAKHAGLTVFVPGTAPGDRVLARILKKKKSFCEAKLLEILEPGIKRITPKCGHAPVCGGCSWQHLDYDTQLFEKTEHVKGHIARIAGLPEVQVHPAIGCAEPFYYRNKMEYSFAGRRWLSEEEIKGEEFITDRGFAAGLHAPGRYDKILNLNECHLQHPISYRLLDFVRSYCLNHNIEPFITGENSGFIRHLVVRTSHHTPDIMVNIVTFSDEPGTMKPLVDAILKKFPEVTTIIHNVNDQSNPTAVGRYEHILHGPGYITDSIHGFSFQIHPHAFFQTNTAQAEKLYSVALQYADVQPDESVFDLYCGVGTLSLCFSKLAKKVIGIELVNVAVENARHNAKANNVKNVEFIKGDMRDTFNDGLFSEFGFPDVLITDPPRAGMHPDVVKKLIELKIPKLVYVSCDSSTMARDLKELSKVYEVIEVQPVDMFPQTYHIESVAKLRLR